MNQTTDQNIDNVVVDTVLKELPVNWNWLLALGIFMLFAGTLGIGMSVMLTLASMIFFAVLIGTGGVLQIVQGIQAKEEKWGGRIFHFVIGLIYMFTTGLIVWDPVAASQGMTIVLAALFTAIGITRIIGAIRCKKNGWRWLLPVLLGLVDIALATLIIVGWPATGLWVIGLFIAIELIMNGWFLTLLAIRVKRSKESSN
jgi:uncharacterized membrane protein HdeD (DUF308 family)